MDEGKKKAVLENLQRLAARIKELEEEVGEQEKRINQLAKLQGNRCWWDGKSCQRYTEINGLQYCGRACSECHRLDKETLSFVLARAVACGGFHSEYEMEQKIEEAEAGGKEEGLENAWNEIHEGLLDLMAGVGVEPCGSHD